MTQDLTLLKVGGAELEHGPVLDHLVDALVGLLDDRKLIVVHGGGRDISQLQARLGIEPCYLEGLRVTDDECMWIAEMALSGTVNKRLAGHLVDRGVKAVGLSGVDAGMLRAEKLTHPTGDLGRVGQVAQVDTALLETLLDQGFTPILSPISLGEHGHPYNVNADHAALALASAMQVSEVIFLTDVPGVLFEDAVLPQLTVGRAHELIEQGHITGGMIPKVESALEAVRHRAQSARITNLEGLASGTGTTVTA